jgi:hypothetical protein
MTTPDLLVADLLPLLRRFCAGGHGIALGGSCAKGTSDDLSDVDVYLFAHAVLPARERADLAAETLGESAQAVSWGTDEPFVHGGTDFTYRGHRVECWLRSVGGVEQAIAECRRGEIRRDYVYWTVMGFFNYAALSDLRTMRVVDDPHGMLGRWKAAVERYPDALRRAVLLRFGREAAFWPENVHYETAVERGDVIYASGIVQQVLHAAIQVVFALNCEYFPGEKGLVGALEKLAVRPPAFAQRVQALLAPAPDGGIAALREQRRALAALVAEVTALTVA